MHSNNKDIDFAPQRHIHLVSIHNREQCQPNAHHTHNYDSHAI